MPPKARNNKKRSKQTIKASNGNDRDDLRDGSVSSQDSVPPKKKMRPSPEVELSATTSHPSHSSVCGRVLTVGQGDVGQLGQGEDVLERKYPQSVRGGDLADKAVCQVICGGMHSMALDLDGEVHSWGCNDEGALGRPSDESNEFTPLRVALPSGVKVVQISAGDSHSAALSSSGVVYVWGVFRDSNGPFGLIDSKPCSLPSRVYSDSLSPAVKITSGSDHVVILTLAGNVVTFGCGEQGQLGRIHEYFSFRGGRKGVGFLLNPAPVKFKKTRGHPQPKFCDVFCGSYHTFALTSDKLSLYAWGLNNYGQLGTDDTDNRFQPERVPECWDPVLEAGLRDLDGGQHHSVLCTQQGSVYAMGRHEYGRLGLGERQREAQTPLKVASVSDVCSVAVGTCVSFAVNKKGEAFSWGMGTNYQLSSGQEDDDLLLPALMKGKNLSGKKVLAVTSGGQHTALLVSSQD